MAETGDDQTSNFRAGIDSFFAWTIDGSLETSGFNIYAAVVGEHDDAVAGGTDLDHYAFLIQAGYMVIPDKLEPFVRYEHIMVDDDFVSGGANAQDVDILTFGFNYYFRKHASKFQFDVVWALDPLTAANTFGTTGSLGGLGLGTDSANGDDQVTIRAQFQLLF